LSQGNRSRAAWAPSAARSTDALIRSSKTLRRVAAPRSDERCRRRRGWRPGRGSSCRRSP